MNLKKNLCEKRKYLIALISQNEIFYHWFKLFSWKSSGHPWKIPSPACGSATPPKKIKKCQPHPFKECFKIFRPPLQKRGGGEGHYAATATATTANINTTATWFLHYCMILKTWSSHSVTLWTLMKYVDTQRKLNIIHT